MYLAELRLINFRNYARLEASFSPGLIVLHGANAQGKTNFLEAVAYLATARSPHASADRELVHFGAREEGLPFAHVEGRVQRADGLHHVRVSVTLGEQEGRRTQKAVVFDGRRLPLLEYIGEVAVIQFLPEDISLIVSSPAVRRRYLDVTICQIDRQYCHDLARYTEALRQRNAALRALQEQGGNPEVAWLWDEPLVRHGSYIIVRRRQIVALLDELVTRVHAELTGGRERLRLLYLPCLELGRRAAHQLSLGLRPTVWGTGRDEPTSLHDVETEFGERLRRARDEELRRGMTLIGPHRDDLRFLVNARDMARFGSRGQQRTAALALRLAEMALIAEKKQDAPLLLLDDIMSELDAHRRAYVGRALEQYEQAFLTTGDLDLLPPSLRAQARLVRVEEGRLVWER